MGNYVNNNLNKGEKLIYVANLHWIIYFSLMGLFTLLIAPAIERSTSEFALTDKRIVVKLGFINRRTLEINLQRLESINIEQSILGRLLGYGTLIVIGTGGTKIEYAFIAKPAAFKKHYQELTAF